MAEDDRLSIDVVTLKIISKRMLQECFGVEPIKTESEWIDKKSLGISGYHKYRCFFDLDKNIDRYLSVVDHFCKMFEGDAHIRADMLLNDLDEKVESAHKLLEVEHFALGTWTGLCGFIEKFTSLTAKSRSASIKGIKASFYHHRQYLEIFFKNDLPSQKFSDVYKIRVDYSNIIEMVVKRELRHRDAFFDLDDRREPMEVYLRVSSVSVYRWSNPELNAVEYCFDGEWERTTQFGSSGSPTYCSGFGATNTFKFKLDPTRGYPANAIYSLFSAAGKPVFFANVKKYELPKNAQPLTCDKGSPDVQYALACLHSLSPEMSLKIAIDGNRKQIQDLLAKLAIEDSSVLTSALYEILHAVDNCSIVDVKQAIEDSFAAVKAGENVRKVVFKREDLPENFFLVKKATVCPSKISIEPPCVVKVNRLLRTLDPDNLMLVDIRDDDRRKLRFDNVYEAKTFIQLCIAERIKKGLKVAGKTFFFLGFTKSQIENYSFWAYAVDRKTSETIASVREKLGIEGDLTSKVQIQDSVFAEALGCVEMDPEWVSEEEGTLDRLRDFKLGIGRISLEALKFVINGCQLDSQLCSAIRVVHGGRRGVLVLDPALNGNQVIYRKSQTFFSSDDKMLYVIETNTIKNAVLNKVFLSTLTSKRHGIEEVFSHEQFLTSMYQTLTDSVSVFREEENLCVDVNLPSLGSLLNEKALSRFADISETFLTDYDIRNDGLFRQVKRCDQLEACRNLKSLKERIEYCYELMPVVDEFGVLGDDEVFIQLGNHPGKQTIVTSTVIVARKNATQPVELRIFRAVNREDVYAALKHLSNCVVLPSKGLSRPLTWLLREADYADGSNVILIANPSLAARENDNYQQVKVPVGRPIVPTCDLEDHYFDYLNYLSYNNFEEVFCALCDSSPMNAYSENCLRTAVSWRLLEEYRRGKTQPAPLQKVDRFPDFLKKISEKKTYPSQRVLGHIFRKVALIDVDNFESIPMDYAELTFQKELQLDGSESFDIIAEKDLMIFKKNLAGLAALYGISVDEVLGGSFFSISNDRLSEKQLEDLEYVVKIHLKHLAIICKRQFKRGMKKASADDVLRKVSAYYVASRNSPENGGYAFPWMFPDLMHQLISLSKPQPPPVTQKKLRKKLLKGIAPNENVELCFKANIFLLIGSWIKANKAILNLSKHDKEYFSNMLTEFQDEAFAGAFTVLRTQQSKYSPLENLQSEPLPVLAEILRQMMFLSARRVDTDFSRVQFFMMAIQALLANTLVRIAATSSLGVLLQPSEILKDKIVKRRMLFTLDVNDDKYIVTTQNDLRGLEKKLCNFSGCQEVNVRLLPTIDESNVCFEEVTAKGSWFAVASLEILLLAPNFRSIMLNLFKLEEQRAQVATDD